MINVNISGLSGLEVNSAKMSAWVLSEFVSRGSEGFNGAVSSQVKV